MEQILLTGATGFLGKVVLEELLRRRDELSIEKIYCLIRPRRTQTADKRFQKEIKRSRCFDNHSTKSWDGIVSVEGDLTLDNCGLKDAEIKELSQNITHVIHCAASVEFDLPVEKAAKANISAALKTLDLAKRFKKLQHMVSVSTAYVNKPTEGRLPIEEKIVPLPRPASWLLKDIEESPRRAEAWIAECGYPNSYTFTKCLTEHLLVENKEHVSLSFVRPSIVSAAFKHPFPSWIDSQAAFAAFVSLVGGGFMRALKGKPGNRLDIVPVDVVSERIVNRTFMIDAVHSSNWTHNVAIVHAVAGYENSERIDVCCKTVERYFQKTPIANLPRVWHLGPKGLRFQVWETLLHKLPLKAGGIWSHLKNDKKVARKAKILNDRLQYTNRAFENFTHNEFRFSSSAPFNDPTFNRVSYIESVCRGVRSYLWRQNPKAVSVAGQKHVHKEKDLLWALKKPKGNIAIRTFGYLLRKMARQSVDNITFDEDSFREAMQNVPKGHRLVVVPTHRSYTDFLICSYLFFERPDLGISIPFIAAAEEFSHIPVLGEFFKKTQAFYIKRGQGREDVTLTEQINDLIHHRATLQFFIEGQRSRSRQFLSPRRGLLRALQKTGEKFAILPVSISYERRPEEADLLKELRGLPKPKMQLSRLLRWTYDLTQGHIRLGRVHAECGSPCLLTPQTDVPALAKDIMGQLQQHTVATDYHLNAFLSRYPELGLKLKDLKQAIVKRGGTVLSSTMMPVEKMGWEEEQCLRYQWQHWFHADIQRRFGTNPAVAHYLSENQYFDNSLDAKEEELNQGEAIAKKLVTPVVESYRAAAQMVFEGNKVLEARQMVRKKHQVHLPYIENALQYLCQEGYLSQDEKGRFLSVPKSKKAIEMRDAFKLDRKSPKWVMPQGDA